MVDRTGSQGAAFRTYFQSLVTGWRTPGDVVSLLMIVNGDIVQRALAQLSGPRLVPVAFPFGWIVYAIQAFSAAMGTGRLMPAAPDLPSIVINVSSGYPRTNQSWILGRLLRDWKYYAKDGLGLYVTLTDVVGLDDLAAAHSKPKSEAIGSDTGSKHNNGPETGNASPTNMRTWDPVQLLVNRCITIFYTTMTLMIF